MTQIVTIQENARKSVESFLDRINENATPHAIQVGCYGLASSYRSLAICSYVLDGDIGQFRNYCSLAEKSWMYFLQKVMLGMEAGDEFIKSTYDNHFYDGLSAGEVKRLFLMCLCSNDKFDEELDELDEYNFSMFLREAVLKNKEKQKIFLDKLKSSLTNKRASYLTLANGLYKEDKITIEEGLKEFAEEYKKQVEANEITDSTEQLLSIKGIGIAKLSNNTGVKVEFDNKFIPNELIQEGSYRDARIGFPKLSENERNVLSQFLNEITK